MKLAEEAERKTPDSREQCPDFIGPMLREQVLSARIFNMVDGSRWSSSMTHQRGEWLRRQAKALMDIARECSDSRAAARCRRVAAGLLSEAQRDQAEETRRDTVTDTRSTKH